MFTCHSTSTPQFFVCLRVRMCACVSVCACAHASTRLPRVLSIDASRLGSSLIGSLADDAKKEDSDWLQRKLLSRSLLVLEKKDLECKQNGHITRHEVLRLGYGQRQKIRPIDQNDGQTSKSININLNQVSSTSISTNIRAIFSSIFNFHPFHTNAPTFIRKKKWLSLSLSSFFFLSFSFPNLTPPTKEMRFYASLVAKLFFQRFPRSASVF